MRLTASGCARFGPPGRDGFLGEPDRETAPLAQAGINTLAAMNVVMLPNQTVFITDTYINENPTAEQIAEIALLAADEVRRFGVTPRVALLSHSSFGSAQTVSAVKMREALELVQS